MENVVDPKKEISISVIMASYNKEKYVQETITSILNQSFSDFELIIVDDGSSDATVSIIKKFQVVDPRIILVEGTTNKGANHCRNIGIQNAKGQYLIFIDADDLLMKDCLFQRYEAAIKHPEANLLVFSMGVFYQRIGDDKRMWRPTSERPLSDFLQHKLPWSILQPLWRRNFMLELGGFDERFQRLQDVEMSTRALLNKDARLLQFDTAPDCYYRIDESRKNFSKYFFLERWVGASIMYSDKFLALVEQKQQRFILGTLYQTMLQIFTHHKNDHITEVESHRLMSLLQQAKIMKQIGQIKRIIFRIALKYNSWSFRIPGANRFFTFCLVS